MYNRALKGSSPEAEAKGLPFGMCAAVSFNHSSAAWQVCWAAHGEKKLLACVALRSAAFGSLLRALCSLTLLARAGAGPHRHALAVSRGRAGVQRRVAASKCCAAHDAKLCNAGLMWLVWCRACTYDG